MTELSDILHGEEAIIQSYLAPLAVGYSGAFGLKDDCAAISPTPGHDLIVKTDPVAEGVHFLPDDPPGDIAWKALAVNVSDLAAKAAVPRAYLMALSFPQAPTRAWMAAFADGLKAAQTAFGMHLIGGDTDRRPGPVTISITVFGEVPAGAMIPRGAAQAGSLIYVSGTLGASAAGLALLSGTAADLIVPADREALIECYRRPQPRLGLREALRAHARAAMDISDGLAKDLGRMAKASGVAARVELSRLPLPHAIAGSAQWRLRALTAGDDYEVLAAIPPASAAAFEVAAAAAGVPVTQVGRFEPGAGLVVIGADGSPLDLAQTGWDHF